jgi:RHS repeat-associated protein
MIIPAATLSASTTATDGARSSTASWALIFGMLWLAAWANAGEIEVRTLAGQTGGAGIINGPSQQAYLTPGNLVVANDGTIYVCDPTNHVVRAISPAGWARVLAGKVGEPGYADGAGDVARFRTPSGIAIDSAGNVVMADDTSVRRITPAGAVTTIAGGQYPGNLNGTGSAASFGGILDICMDASGNIYTASGSAIRRVTAAGVVTTYAGDMYTPGTANGTLTAARFNGLRSMAIRGSTIYALDGSGIRVLASGAVTTIALPTVTTSSGGFDEYFTPADIAVDASGVLYLVGGTKVYARSTAGLWSKLAGADPLNTQYPYPTYPSADGPVSQALFGRAKAIAIAANGTIHVSDLAAIRTISDQVRTVAGRPYPPQLSIDGPASQVRFTQIQSSAVYADGSVLVADLVSEWLGTHFGVYLRRVSASGTTTFLAGRTSHSYPMAALVDGTGTAAYIGNVQAMAARPDGGAYILDSGRLRLVSATGQVTTIAGPGDGTGVTDGVGAAASFSWATSGMAYDSLSGNVYVADAYNHTIRRVTPAGAVTTVAGAAGFMGSSDGTGAAARFNAPRGCAVDAVGNLYIADFGNQLIRKMTPAGVVTTVAGALGQSVADPFGGPPLILRHRNIVDGTGSAARLVSPTHLAFTSTGDLLFYDGAYEDLSDYGGPDKPLLRRMTPTGTVTTILGTENYYGAADGAGVRVGFGSRTAGFGVAADGSILFADGTAIRRGAPAAAPTLGAVAAFSGALQSRPYVISYAAMQAAADEADADSAVIDFAVVATGDGTLGIRDAGSTALPHPARPGEAFLAAGKELVWTPSATALGATTAFSVMAWDGAQFSATAIPVAVSVAQRTNAPTISAITAKTTAEDTATASIAITVGDPDTPVANLVLSGQSSDPTLIDPSGMTFGGTTASRTLVLRPKANRFGVATITVTVSDGVATASTSFTLTVTSANDLPVVTAVPTLAGVEDTGIVISVLTLRQTMGVSDDDPWFTPIISAVSTGTLKVRTLYTATWASVTAGQAVNDSQELLWTPAANANGTVAAFTVKARDPVGGVSAAAMTVNAVLTAINDPPTMAAITNRSTSEDVATASIGITISDVEAVAAATLSGSSNNPALVDTADMTFGGTGTARTLVIRPKPNMNGTAQITVTVADNGTPALTASQSFTLTVTAVNDVPTLTAVNPIIGAKKNLAFAIPHPTLLAASNAFDVELQGDLRSQIRFRVQTVSSGTLRYRTRATGTQPAGATLTLTLGTSGTSITDAHELLWTPPANSTTNVSPFTIRAFDGTANSATNVAVPVVFTLAPTLVSIAPLTGGTEDQPYTITFAALRAAATITDDDTVPANLTFKLQSVVSGSLVQQGGAPIASGDVIDTNTTLVWTPPANAFGELDSFVVKAFDGTDVSAEALPVKISLASIPDVPVLTSITPLTGALKGQPFIITRQRVLSASDASDGDGTVPDFRIESVGSGTLTIRALNGTGAGTAVTVGTILNGTQELVWTPPAGQSGQLTACTVKATDGTNLSSTAVAMAVVVPNLHRRYVYDAAGNRTAVIEDGVQVQTCTYDRLNRLLTSAVVSGGVTTTTTHAYDLNGSTITRTVGGTIQASMTWDASNRLRTLSSGGVIETNTYDYRTRRTKQQLTGGTTSTTVYRYDGGDSFGEVDGTTTTKHVTFVRSGGLGGGIGSIVQRRVGTGATATSSAETFHYNPAVGHVLATTASDRSVTSANRYDAWGRRLQTFGSSTNRRLANTKERDTVGGVELDNHGFRYYDPALGRYISRDPLGYPNGLNNYLYVGNNPINRTDPLGLFWGLIVDAVSVVADTYQVATGQISGGEYAKRMAVTAVSVAANVVSAGTGGLAVRAAASTIKAADKAIEVANRAAAVGETVTAASEGRLADAALSAIDAAGGGGKKGTKGHDGGKPAATAQVDGGAKPAAGGQDTTLTAAGGPPEAANRGSNIVYRGLTAADAEAVAAGRGLAAKAPNGTWTAAEHVANAGPGAGGAKLNSPWISTSRRLDVAQAYDSGHGVIAIDLNKVPSFQAEVWRTAPRVNGVEGLPYHRSIWAQEVTVFQDIPAGAIIGPVK